MYEQHRFPRLAWIPIAAGVAWIAVAASLGMTALLLTIPVSGPLLATGLALLLWPGDIRILQTMALAGVIAVLVSIPMLFAAGFFEGVVLAALGAATLLTSGASAVYQEPWLPGVPRPEPGVPLAAKVAIDEVILGFEQFSVGLPVGDHVQRVSQEIVEARALFTERGWLADPVAYHPAPPPIEQPRLRTKQSGRITFEHLSFESGYAPHEGEPGRERWLGYEPSRTGHAWVLRHREGDRPWLVCSNGYRTGHAPVDLRLFWHYYANLGLNVLMPVLPLHGPRRVGRLSGDGFLGGEVLDCVHAEAQAIWDLRRLVGWARQQGAPAVGILGLSLGGYTTALAAGIEPGLACAVAGIPVTNLARIFWRHGPRLQLDYLEHVDIDEDAVAELMRVVSPLAVEPLVPLPGRMIFGGISDRLVPPDHVQNLFEHWGHPRMVWYQGGHLTFQRDPRVQAGIDATLHDVKLTS